MLDQKIFDHILSVEGGFSTDKKDPGNFVNGVFKGTKYGISAQAYPDLDIANITKETANSIYYRDYWLASRCDLMEPVLAICVFDASVNMGVGRSIKILQKLLAVKQDGVFGPITEASLTGRDQVKLAGLFTQERIKVYGTFKQFSRYGASWVSRTNKTYIFAMEYSQDQTKTEEPVEAHDPVTTKRETKKELPALIASSSDSTKLSMTIKAGVVFIAGVLMQNYGVEFDSAVIEQASDLINEVIVSGGKIFMAIGGLRRIYNIAKEQFDSKNK